MVNHLMGVAQLRGYSVPVWVACVFCVLGTLIIQATSPAALGELPANQHARWLSSASPAYLN
jgi:hypothetical protein